MMSDIDLAPLIPAIEAYIPMGRSGLLPALHAAQKIYGWISEPVAAQISKSLHVPLADIHGVIEFSSLFYNEPVAKRIIRVCADQACALKGAAGLLDLPCHNENIRAGQTPREGTLSIEATTCLGLCEQAPAALLDSDAETNISSDFHHHELG